MGCGVPDLTEIFESFKKICNFRETKVGMWTSGMGLECLYGDGAEHCKEEICLLFKEVKS